MSLNVARYAAFSAITASQTRISIASANVANADTEGYTKKTATQSTTVSSGTGTGVEITKISSTTDKLLLKSLLSAYSASEAASVTDSYATQLQSILGSVSGDDGSGTSLANSLASLESAISELADTPESSTLKEQVVNAIDDLAAQLRDTSSSIQTLRKNADSEIADDVDTANSLLNTIADLNKQISSDQAAGLSTGDLEDQRNSALQSLSGLMDVSYFTTSNNEVRVYTKSGVALVDSTVHELEFSEASTVTASTGTLSGISVNGIDVTGSVSSGSIGALIEQRDVTLPAMQDEFDELAGQLASTLNEISNEGTASPPPESLTGTTEVSASHAFTGTGTTRFAVTDSSGNLVSYADLNLSSYSTVGDLVNAIDAIDGLDASIDSDGHVVISATDSGNGVAVKQLSGEVGSTGYGVSQWLGLNDMVTATGASDFTVRSSLLQNADSLPSSVLSSDTTLSVGDRVVTSGSTDVVQQLYDALTSDKSFSAAGAKAAKVTTLADYATGIVSQAATAASRASDTLTTKQTVYENLSSSMSSETGVNVDEETAQISQLQNEYEAAAKILETINSLFSTLLTAVQSS